MEDLIRSFIQYIEHEKRYSEYTKINYLNDLSEFKMYLKSESIDSIMECDYIVIRNYLMSLYNRKLKRKSISRKLSTLRSFFNYLIKIDYIEQNPIQLISSPKKEQKLPTFLYSNEMDKLISSIDRTSVLGKRNYLIVELLYSSGIRVSELCSIHLEDIDFYNQSINIIGKGNKERIVSFGEYANEALEDYIYNARDVLLLKNKNTKPKELLLNHLGEELSTRGVRYIIDQLVQTTSINTKVTPHVLRHTFATHLLNEGCDLRTVQELLGHAHLSSTQIYTHVTTDKMKDVYLKAHPRSIKK